MFGRIRASSSSSLERPPSKILKDDSFSIYGNIILLLLFLDGSGWFGFRHDNHPTLYEPLVSFGNRTDRFLF